jgi:hypothetical protein
MLSPYKPEIFSQDLAEGICLLSRRLTEQVLAGGYCKPNI